MRNRKQKEGEISRGRREGGAGQLEGGEWDREQEGTLALLACMDQVLLFLPCY